jgi:hypothetical protein
VLGMPLACSSNRLQFRGSSLCCPCRSCCCCLSCSYFTKLSFVCQVRKAT